MLSKEDSSNKTYRYLNNVINCAWMSGYIFQLSSDRKSFYLKQSDYTSGLFLIELDKNDYLPQNYQEGSSIKIYARVLPHKINGIPSIVLRVLSLEEASISELPPIETEFIDGENDKRNYDFFQEFGLEKPYGSAINNVMVAGFLDNLVFDKNPKGEKKSDCLLLDLCVGPDVVLPVRINGKRCQVQFDQVKGIKNRGKYLPIAFLGVKLKTKTIESNDSESPFLITYLHADKITFMNNDLIRKYFLGKPLWLHKLIEAKDDK